MIDVPVAFYILTILNILNGRVSLFMLTHNVIIYLFK